jgi:CRP-like cAMP-binding protein
MPPIDAFVKKLGRYCALNQADLCVLRELQGPVREFSRGAEIGDEYEERTDAYILLEGWVHNYKLTRDGGRQIISFPVAGDIIGLRSLLLPVASYASITLTDVTVCLISRERLVDVMTRFTHIAASILWTQAHEEAITVEHLVSVGRRTALERVAHLLVELVYRLRLSGLASGWAYDCPLGQHELADALGLSVVHINRVLRQLRERQIVTFRQNRVVIHDIAALREVAGFDSSYLDPEGALE